MGTQVHKITVCVYGDSGLEHCISIVGNVFKLLISKMRQPLLSNALFCARSLLRKGNKSAWAAFSKLTYLIETHNDCMSIVWGQTSHTLLGCIFFVGKEMLVSSFPVSCQVFGVLCPLCIWGRLFCCFYFSEVWGVQLMYFIKQLKCPVDSIAQNTTFFSNNKRSTSFHEEHW